MILFYENYWNYIFTCLVHTASIFEEIKCSIKVLFSESLLYLIVNIKWKFNINKNKSNAKLDKIAFVLLNIDFLHNTNLIHISCSASIQSLNSKIRFKKIYSFKLKYLLSNKRMIETPKIIKIKLHCKIYHLWLVLFDTKTVLLRHITQ